MGSLSFSRCLVIKRVLMKLCGIFLVLALAGAATAASIGQHPPQQPAGFTSELDDGFVATLPKSAIGSLVDDQENSLEPQPIIKLAPALAAQEETHIPVTVVQEPVQQDSKKSQAVKVDVIAENAVPKPALVQIKEENPHVPQQAESKPAENKPNDSIIPDHEGEDCDKEKKIKEATKIAQKEKVKEVVNLEQTRQSDLTPAPVAPVVIETPVTQPPNIIQQGIANIQQGISNIQSFGQSITNSIGSTIASIVAPITNNPPNQSSPPNLFTNIQSTIQNIIRPPATSSDSTTPPQNGLLEGIQNFSQGIRDGIVNMQNTFQSFLNNAFGGQNNNNSNGNRNTTNILEQGIQSLQQGVQNGLQNLNNTIQSVTNPSPDRPGLIQAGIQNLQQGVKNITTGIQNIILPPVNADGSRPGVIQATVQTLSQNLQQGVQNLNNTIQNIIKPAETSADGKPGVEVAAASAAATRLSLEQAFLNELRAINATLDAGVKALTMDLAGMTSEPKVEVTPVGEAVIVDA